MVFLYEENQRNIKLYDGSTLHFLHEIPLPFSILAIEFIPDKNSLCVSLSNRTFMFFEAQNIRTKLYTLADYTKEAASNKVRKFNLPSTQKCLCYVQRKRLLFSAGTDGAVFAWKIEKIFSNEYQEAALAQQARNNKKGKRDADKG